MPASLSESTLEPRAHDLNYWQMLQVRQIDVLIVRCSPVHLNLPLDPAFEARIPSSLASIFKSLCSRIMLGRCDTVITYTRYASLSSLLTCTTYTSDLILAATPRFQSPVPRHL